MSKFERIFYPVMLTICAALLLLILVNSIQASKADLERRLQAQIVQDMITNTAEEIDTVIQNYEDAAYNSTEVDRISEQQLLATETTNALLVRLSYQLSLLAQMQQ